MWGEELRSTAGLRCSSALRDVQSWMDISLCSIGIFIGCEDRIVSGWFDSAL